MLKMVKRVLFLCTHNSARSQMAEGLTNALFPAIQAFSAGTEATFVHPLAIEVLKEVGIDISHHTSKSLHQFLNEAFDVVVTVCDHAREVCPIFPRASLQIHHSFPDPSQVQGTRFQQLQAFRQTRDAIKAWLETDLAPLVFSLSPSSHEFSSPSV